MTADTSTPAALVADLDAQVRAVVRRDGVDPQADQHRVRRIAEQVVRDHDERSLTGAVLPVGDRDGVVAELFARVAGHDVLHREVYEQRPRHAKSSGPPGLGILGWLCGRGACVFRPGLWLVRPCAASAQPESRSGYKAHGGGSRGEASCAAHPGPPVVVSALDVDLSALLEGVE